MRRLSPFVSMRPPRHLRPLTGEEVRAVRISDFDPLALPPAKSPDYFVHRYVDHPFYRYRVFAVEDERRLFGLLVTRTARAAGASAVRIVDYWGRDEGWIGLGPALTDLVREEQAEYADLYSGGLNTDVIRQAGMVPHHVDDPVVVPHYFEPFERKNKAPGYGYVVPPRGRYRMFKADSDQDRPNFPAVRGTPSSEG